MSDRGSRLPEPAFFRREHARLVARLTRRFGAEHLQRVEDAAQSALLAAVERWPVDGVPDEPSAWTWRVAHNHVVGDLRRAARRRRLLAALPAEAPAAPETPPLAGELGDDLLRMLFVCCDEGVPVPARVPLALRTLCGLDAGEIAARLGTTVVAVERRLGRGRAALRQRPPRPELRPDAVVDRLPAVRATLYALFAEGHLSSREEPLRRDLCDEAVRLTSTLADHPLGDAPDTWALLAWMHLTRARLAARVDAAGLLLLLSEQDAARWEPSDVADGVRCLARSATGERFGRWHAEAAIAAEITRASGPAAIRWDRVARWSELLARIEPSPSHTLLHAVAVGQQRGAAEGLLLLRGAGPPPGGWEWDAVLAAWWGELGNADEALRHRRAALASAPSDAVRRALARRLDSLVGDASPDQSSIGARPSASAVRTRSTITRTVSGG